MTRTISEDKLGKIMAVLRHTQKAIGQRAYSGQALAPQYVTQIANALLDIERELARLPVTQEKERPAATPAGRL